MFNPSTPLAFSQLVLVKEYADYPLRLPRPDLSRLATTSDNAGEAINVARQ